MADLDAIFKAYDIRGIVGSEIDAEACFAVGAAFGDAVELSAFQFSDGTTLELQWRIIGEVAGDWRVFAVVFAEPFQSDMANDILFQMDAAPPVPLAFLKVGERVVTRHDFQLPAGYSGSHEIYVGWYNDDIGARLSLPHPADMLPLPAQDFLAARKTTE